MTVLDLQIIRYINLLDNASKVKTSKCFTYNNTIFFAVPKSQMSKAIGPNAVNIRRIQDQLEKKVKIIAEPNGVENVGNFIADIVAPVRFVSVDVKDGVINLNAGSQSKAALIGRNRRREDELKQILKDNFNLDLKIL
ncbi:MAG: hypothetical protein WCK29_02125 [archaeon]